MHRKIPLVRGFDDVFLAPHSRHTKIDDKALKSNNKLTVLAESEEAGAFFIMADGG